MSRLGPAYWRLWCANAVSYVGDGAMVSALPLFALTVTKDPRLISLVSAAIYVPWLLVSLPAGAIVDRHDRVTLMWRSQAVQCAVMCALLALVVTHLAGIAVLVAGGLLLGTAEVVFSNAAQSVLPALVPAQQLEQANGTQQIALTAGETFVGPPVGSALFGVAAALPFGLDALSFAGSAALLASLPRVGSPPRPGAAPASTTAPVSGAPAAGEPEPGTAAATGPTSMRAEITEGLGWLARHRTLRVVAVLLGVVNFASQMGQATMVLLATQVLHSGTAGFGLLWTVSAVGSVIGGVVNPAITRRIGLLPSLMISMAAFAGVYTGLGLSPDFGMAVALMAFSGFAVTMWNIVTVSLRQRVVPAELLGRVNSAYRMIGWGPIPLGALAGGLVAHEIGLRAPYVIGGILCAVTLAASLPALRGQDHSGPGEPDGATVATGRSAG
jgi:MFS family permease